MRDEIRRRWRRRCRLAAALHRAAAAVDAVGLGRRRPAWRSCSPSAHRRGGQPRRCRRHGVGRTIAPCSGRWYRLARRPRPRRSPRDPSARCPTGQAGARSAPCQTIRASPGGSSAWPRSPRCRWLTRRRYPLASFWIIAIATARVFRVPGVDLTWTRDRGGPGRLQRADLQPVPQSGPGQRRRRRDPDHRRQRRRPAEPSVGPRDLPAAHARSGWAPTPSTPGGSAPRPCSGNARPRPPGSRWNRNAPASPGSCTTWSATT